MDIVVTIKQVPDPDIPPHHFKVDEANKRIVGPPGVAPVMNGYDANALEEALRIREKQGGKVTVVTLGPDGARDTLKRAIAMGADAAVHVNDAALLDRGSSLTARVLAAAIQKIGPFDLVLSGRQASDTDAGLTHILVAEALGVPAVSPVSKLESVDAESAVARRAVDDGYQRIKVRLPALLGVSSELNEPRYPPLKGIMAAGRAQIPVWSAMDLNITDLEPRVELRRLYQETREARVELIEADSPAEAGTKLADKLREAGLV
ncbi:MAG: electron transfer flavoprotein subunit beta/FixA family protein [Chloroflexi bacterium]|nr:electron transfer flavoprotein subunit beta/FixA family protein [Chloroflexota bacterium]